MPRLFLLTLALGAGVADVGRGDEKPAVPCAGVMDDFFKDEVWAKVGVRKCLTCHKPGGEAEQSKFILKDPRKSEGAAQDEAMKHNRAAFAKMAALKEKGQSRILLKGRVDRVDVKPDRRGVRISDYRPVGHRAICVM